MPSGIYRVGFPRTDLKATLDEVELKPSFALGLARLREDGFQGMVMGDLVLTENEVNPVMTKLAAGIEVRRCTITCCAISLSRCTCMCRGTAIQSSSLRHCTRRLPKPRRRSPPLLVRRPRAVANRPRHDRDHQTLVSKGTNNGGVYRFGISRAEPIEEAAWFCQLAVKCVTQWGTNVASHSPTFDAHLAHRHVRWWHDQQRVAMPKVQSPERKSNRPRC
jgi:Domain of Unknown Function (DUF1259)